MYMYMCRAEPGPVIVVVVVRLGLLGLAEAGFPARSSQSAPEEVFTYEKTIKIAQAITHIPISIMRLDSKHLTTS